MATTANRAATSGATSANRSNERGTHDRAAAVAGTAATAIVARILRASDRSIPVGLQKRYFEELASSEPDQSLVDMLSYIFAQYHAVRNELNTVRDLLKIGSVLAQRFTELAVPFDLALDSSPVTTADVLAEIAKRTPRGYASIQDYLDAARRGEANARYDGFEGMHEASREQTFARRYAGRVLLATMRKYVELMRAGGIGGNPFGGAGMKQRAPGEPPRDTDYFVRHEPCYESTEDDRRECEALVESMYRRGTQSRVLFDSTASATKRSADNPSVSDSGVVLIGAARESNNDEDDDLCTVSTRTFARMMRATTDRVDDDDDDHDEDDENDYDDGGEGSRAKRARLLSPLDAPLATISELDETSALMFSYNSDDLSGATARDDYDDVHDDDDGARRDETSSSNTAKNETVDAEAPRDSFDGALVYADEDDEY